MAHSFKHTPIDQISQIHARLNKTFLSGKTLPLEYRRAQLLALARLTQENAEAFFDALNSDLGRHKFEGNFPEISPVITACIRAANSLEEWAKPDKPAVEEWRKDYDTTVYKVPKGIIINIAPWNYPVVLSILPLVGAISAGCTCVLKPSEHSPAVSSLLAELFPKYLDQDAFVVINGAEFETAHILELKWDHIFFTGSTRVGRIVAVAAAKQITPVTLELGGKSPVFIDADAIDLEIAAKRVLWGKIQNAGQVCVAPDYVLVPRHQHDALITALGKAYESFWPYPKGSLDPKSELSNIIHLKSQARLQKLITDTKGTIVMGGQSVGKRIAPAIIKNVQIEDVLMEDEIFGPILPIVPVDDVNEAITIIRSRPNPLVVYVFTESQTTKDLFLQWTRSGQLIFNDTFQQVGIYEMPFGGCGDSGYGAYLGKYSFNTFTHLRGSINVPMPVEPFMALRYPPYTEEAYESALTAGSRTVIPDI